MREVFDWVLLELYSNSFNTSDLQFDCKSGSSTVTCTYVLDEVTNYYNQRGSDVFVVFLDASIFVASNGVKQGGVLSPILYGIYND